MASSKAARLRAHRGAAAFDSSPPTWATWGGVAALALVIRFVHVWAIHGTPLFDHLVGDGQAYDAWAQRIAAGDWIGQGVFYQAPLYPYFLAAIYATAGHNLLLARIVQALCGAGSCVLLGIAGSRFFSPQVGLGAAVALALWPSEFFADALIQKSALDSVLLCGLLAALSYALQEPRPRWWLTVGIALGGLILTRENALAFAPVLLIGLFFHFRHIRWASARVRAAAAFLLGLAIVLFPVALRNGVVSGEMHLTTVQFGPNFYIGNNPTATGLYQPLRSGRGDPEFEQRDATELAEHAVGHSLTPGEVSRYWASQAGHFITTQPGAWLAVLARKAVLLVNRIEVGDAEDQYTYGEWSPLLAVLGPVLNFGLLVPLAAAGIVLSWPRRRDLGLLLALLAVYALTVVATYVMARYRYPLLPLLLLFAVAGTVESVRSVRTKRWGRLLPAAVAALCATVPANWSVIPQSTVRAVTVYNLANVLWAQGKVNEAITQYVEALRLQPASAEAHNNLGLALAAQGRIGEAVAHYTQALRLDPSSAEAHSNYGGALVAQGKIEQALAEYAEALRLQPTYAEAHNNLAIALANKGNLGEALTHFEQALRSKPNYPEARNNLGNVLQAQGRLGEAIVQYREALRLRPGYTDAHNNLAMALAEQEENERTMAH